MQIIMCNKIIA